MFSNPTQSEPRLSPAATTSDATPSSLTPPLHCASILQPTAPPQVVAFDPLLFLFEPNHNYYVDNQGFVPWRLRRLGRSKVRSASLVRVLSDGKIFWALGPQDLRKSSTSHNLSKTTIVFFGTKKEGKKRRPEGQTPALLAFESY